MKKNRWVEVALFQIKCDIFRYTKQITQDLTIMPEIVHCDWSLILGLICSLIGRDAGKDN